MQSLYKKQNTTIDEAGMTWFEPRQYVLDNFNNVLWADYFEMSSSAGDWSGIAIIKRYNTFYAIPFSQESRYPYYGYRLHIGRVLFESDKPIRKDEAFEAVENEYMFA